MLSNTINTIWYKILYENQSRIMNKKFIFLLLLFFNYVIQAEDSRFIRHNADSVNATPAVAALSWATLIYKSVQRCFRISAANACEKMSKMSLQEWRSFVEKDILKGKILIDLTAAERRQLFESFELYQYDGYRLLIASLPDFKAFALEMSRNPSKEFLKSRKHGFYYSKEQAHHIARYYYAYRRYNEPLSQEMLKSLPEHMLATDLGKILSATLPSSIIEFIHDEVEHHNRFSTNQHPEFNPRDLVLNELRKQFSAQPHQSTTTTQRHIAATWPTSQHTRQMFAEKNLDLSLLAAIPGAQAQQALHGQFVSLIDTCADTYVRYTDYKDLTRITVGATRYSLAGISLVKSNQMALAYSAHKVASALLAFAQGVTQACSGKLNQIHQAVHHPLLFSRQLSDLAIHASSEVTLFTVQALKNPTVQKNIIKLAQDPLITMADLGRIAAHKLGIKLATYAQTHTLEQMAYDVGKELTDLALDAVLLHSAGKVVKTLKISQKLGAVSKQTSKFVGYLVIGTDEAASAAAGIIAQGSTEAITTNPIIRAALANTSCEPVLQEISFKALPQTVSTAEANIIAAHGLPKSFIPGLDKAMLYLDESVNDLSHAVDVFGNKWQKIASSGEEVWKVTSPSKTGENFLLQAEPGLIEIPSIHTSLKPPREFLISTELLNFSTGHRAL